MPTAVGRRISLNEAEPSLKCMPFISNSASCEEIFRRFAPQNDRHSGAPQFEDSSEFPRVLWRSTLRGRKASLRDMPTLFDRPTGRDLCREDARSARFVPVSLEGGATRASGPSSRLCSEPCLPPAGHCAGATVPQTHRRKMGCQIGTYLLTLEVLVTYNFQKVAVHLLSRRASAGPGDGVRCSAALHVPLK